MDIKLKDFEGPLDLLLHLVSKYEMDIYDVPIAEVIEQYLTYISTLQTMRLEVAGEYMVMASQLMLIKSRKLLPKVVELEPEMEDPELELLGQIEEYRKYKLLGQELAEKHSRRAQFFSKPKEELIYEDITLMHDRTTIDLFLAFSKIMAEKQAMIKYSHTTIDRDDYRIEDMMELIEESLEDETLLPLSRLFERATSKSETITLFLATLELIKVHRVTVIQKENFGDILLKKERRPHD